MKPGKRNHQRGQEIRLTKGKDGEANTVERDWYRIDNPGGDDVDWSVAMSLNQ